VLDDREKQVQVPQAETPANLTVGIELSRHTQNWMVVKEIRELSYIKIDLILQSSRMSRVEGRCGQCGSRS
jgi:hypothetical protein